jgi:hypothetical protein
MGSPDARAASVVVHSGCSRVNSPKTVNARSRTWSDECDGVIVVIARFDDQPYSLFPMKCNPFSHCEKRRLTWSALLGRRRRAKMHRATQRDGS